MHSFTATSQNATKVIVKELYKHRYAYTHRYTYTLILRNIHTDRYRNGKSQTGRKCSECVYLTKVLHSENIKNPCNLMKPNENEQKI